MIAAELPVELERLPKNINAIDLRELAGLRRQRRIGLEEIPKLRPSMAQLGLQLTQLRVGFRGAGKGS
jgi:hypothetical protein